MGREFERLRMTSEGTPGTQKTSGSQLNENSNDKMAGTTGLEPATSHRVPGYCRTLSRSSLPIGLRRLTMVVGARRLARRAKSHVTFDELANSITHGVGLGLSIAGLAALLILAIVRGGAWQIVGCAIYGITLVSLYASSTLYHGLPSRRVKRVFRIFDHSAIFLLIAGTYTPFLLVNLRGAWGWSLLGIVWGLAAAGIVSKVWFVDR